MIFSHAHHHHRLITNVIIIFGFLVDTFSHHLCNSSDIKKEKILFIKNPRRLFLKPKTFVFV